MDGPENGNFSLLYVAKMSLCRWVGGLKNLKTPLRNIKMAPKGVFNPLNGPLAQSISLNKMPFQQGKCFASIKKLPLETIWRLNLLYR